MAVPRVFGGRGPAPDLGEGLRPRTQGEDDPLRDSFQGEDPRGGVRDHKKMMWLTRTVHPTYRNLDSDTTNWLIDYPPSETLGYPLYDWTRQKH